jgi:SAM-dependent methyltransferase
VTAVAANAGQIAYWNGPVGEHWKLEQEAIDRAFAAFTAKLREVAGLRRGDRVLDVGCGCGTTTLFAADAVGAEGSVVGIDVSVPMVARASERSAGRANVSYLLADAAGFRFDGGFDVEISRFGVMFFEDPVRAFANLRSALRPGGRIAFACWRPPADNAWVRVPREVALRHVPPAPPVGPDEPGPFSFGDAARVRRILEGAGFSRVDIAPFDAGVVLSEEGVDVAADFVMTTGPTAALLREASDETKARVRPELEARLRSFTHDGRTTLGGAVWMVSAA